jgi:hypothetical protein
MFTALLIAILIVAGAATVVGGGLVLAAQRRRGIGEGDRPMQLTDGGTTLVERTLSELRVGDVVQHEGRDFLVEGTIHYDEDGHRWVAGRLVDGAEIRWLVVGMERVGAGSLRLLASDEGLEISGYPPEAIVHAGHRFVLEKRGTATVKTAGEAGVPPPDRSLAPESVVRCRWWRYETAGRDCLVVEQWSGAFRALRGVTVVDTEIELIPGS